MIASFNVLAVIFACAARFIALANAASAESAAESKPSIESVAFLIALSKPVTSAIHRPTFQPASAAPATSAAVPRPPIFETTLDKLFPNLTPAFPALSNLSATSTKTLGSPPSC
ncbi:hypothetical protein L0152_07215 [bacterium]|nr:hypothetical protein [bacterium]